jgi:hypothetical protein
MENLAAASSKDKALWDFGQLRLPCFPTQIELTGPCTSRSRFFYDLNALQSATDESDAKAQEMPKESCYRVGIGTASLGFR